MRLSDFDCRHGWRVPVLLGGLLVLCGCQATRGKGRGDRMTRGSIVGHWQGNGDRFVFGADGDFLWTGCIEDDFGSASDDERRVLVYRGRWSFSPDGIIQVVASGGVCFELGLLGEDSSFTIDLESANSSQVSIRVRAAGSSELYVLKRGSPVAPPASVDANGGGSGD